MNQPPRLPPTSLPLSGITVVSLEQAIAAPLASRHLADWGARVIKIERPGKGDFCRDYDYVMNGMSSQFAWTNRSKESLALDVKSAEGKRVLDALLPHADVFLQNLAPGAAQRLGLDGATLVERFPRLIACDISGYGSGGPYSQKKAYDLLVQCEAGFLSVNGTQEQPAKCGIAVVDTATGMYILNGVLMALFNRERTGKGMAFEVSLFDSMTEWMSYPAYYTEGAGKPLVRTGTRHATIAPYGPFRDRRRRRGVLRHSERTRMDRAVFAGAGGCGAGQRPSLLHQSAAHAKPRCAGSLDRAAIRKILGRTGDRSGSTGRDRERQYEYGRSVPQTSAASCSRSRAQSGIAERTADELSARDHHSRRRPL